MAKMQIINSEDFGYDFIDSKYLPAGKDEYYIRLNQTNHKKNKYRQLDSEEIERLIKNGNSSTDWSKVLVEDPFDTDLITNSMFAGLVRISSMQNFYLKYHDFTAPAGITNSKIISCDIGENCAIHYCAYLSHYIIGDRVILSRIDEMCTTDHSKFGEGLVKEGEDEKIRVKIDVINEAGGREVFPFYDLITSDAFMWARYRDDAALIKKFEEITQNSQDSRRGYYGEVGEDSAIKSCRIIKDVNFGSSVYVKGANKLKNLTIKSTADEPSQIGEGVELVNGIIGLGSRVFYGVKAVRFVIGNNCELKYGTRLIHSIVGDNSTISCCEVLNALIFPYHEQHHNNSFLVAAMIQGQSNMAAGATVGSNHNTRGNDGEIIAGRGFWPGLSTTLKHNSRFASFVLLSKANYPAELDIPFPFSLVLNDAHEDRLEIIPAYYWMYNMYAIERNNKKFLKRDKRKTKTQHIETNYLAPDTVAEILESCSLLEKWICSAWVEAGNHPLEIDNILKDKKDEAKKLFVKGENIERSKRTVKIIKAVESYEAYRDMLIWYGVTALAEYFDKNDFADKIGNSIEDFKLSQETDFNWVNMGGQLIPERKIDSIKTGIKSGKFKTWKDIHSAYDAAYDSYRIDKAENAYAVLCRVMKVKAVDTALWNTLLDKACNIRKYIEEQIFYTKNKDYNNHFRDITYRNPQERNAVLGNVEDNALIRESKEDTKYYLNLFKRHKA
ncbi:MULTISPECIES: DUF4954 family protein [unclassified Treponema]|uniref:DUF4954 family protein n=1 Tax=unclassified Treponema TaxID=2638727 RepID=UPI0020A28850|nr:MULTISPECIES: DUF4954 family protein [unclassified Treponema]UTC67357.1 DUF4954 family protein [Treponema sp. OMZ 789]UTC70085.1 DUF4954 family protein [Treponema sp. OMZ 790]UTC72801.1 DUF4954 family protein [Treponema sp. OMZ 791]